MPAMSAMNDETADITLGLLTGISSESVGTSDSNVGIEHRFLTFIYQQKL